MNILHNESDESYSEYLVLLVWDHICTVANKKNLKKTKKYHLGISRVLYQKHAVFFINALYAGNFCEILLPCHSSPCQNGGSCQQAEFVPGLWAITSCNCPATHTGNFCQIELICANNNPCLNGGTCTDTCEHIVQSCSASCSCDATTPTSYFTGEFCQFENPNAPMTPDSYCEVECTPNTGVCQDPNLFNLDHLMLDADTDLSPGTNVSRVGAGMQIEFWLHTEETL